MAKNTVTGHADMLEGDGFTPTPQGGTSRPKDPRKGTGSPTGNKLLKPAKGLIEVDSGAGTGLPHDGGKMSKGPERK